MPPVLSLRPGVAILSSRRLDVWLADSRRVFPTFSLGKGEQMKHLAGLRLPKGAFVFHQGTPRARKSRSCKKKRKEKEKKKYFQGALGTFLLTFVVQLEIQKKKRKGKRGGGVGGSVGKLFETNK